MKTLGALCAALLLISSSTGCYYCSYEYNPYTGKTERVWHKLCGHDKDDDIHCGSISCGSFSCGGCGGVVGDCACGSPEVVYGCDVPEPVCALPQTCGCEIPATCGCEVPATCGCEVPETCGCEVPETCGCGLPVGCACGAPYVEGGTVYAPPATYSAPTTVPQPEAQPSSVPSTAPPAVGASYVIPTRRYR